MRAKNAVRSTVIESARLAVTLVARFAKSVADTGIVVVRRVTGAQTSNNVARVGSA